VNDNIVSICDFELQFRLHLIKKLACDPLCSDGVIDGGSSIRKDDLASNVLMDQGPTDLQGPFPNILRQMPNIATKNNGGRIGGVIWKTLAN